MTTKEFFIKMEETDELDGKPIPEGAWFAYRAWLNTEANRVEMFEADEIPWGNALKNGAMVDFVNCLRSAGVTEFAVTDHSTALMEGIHALVSAGCSIKSPVTVKRHPKYWGDEVRVGLIFTIN